MFTRRAVVQGILGAGAVSLLPLRRFHLPALAQSCSHGTLYNGFILLVDGDSTPTCVAPPSLFVPSPCGRNEPGTVDPTYGKVVPDVTSFATPGDLAAAATFSIYDLGSVPSGLQVGEVKMTYHPAGPEYESSISYLDANGTAVIELAAQPDHMTPFPLWSIVADVDDPFSSVPLEQVTFLPTAGIFMDCGAGAYTSYWIQSGVLYILQDRVSQSRSAAITLASSLTTI